MNHISDKRSSSDRTSASHYFSDAQVPVTRLKNFIDELAEEVSSGHTQVSTDSMAQTDALFAIEVIIDYLMHRAVTSQTREKKTQLRRLYSKALFIQMLEKDGGIYSSARAAEVLGKTKTTVKNWKDAGRLLAIEIDGEFYFPAFQFTEDKPVSDRGVLKGLPELLQALQKQERFSDRMQYSFFMEERNTVLNGLQPAGRTFTVASLLRSAPEPAVMDELHRLARVYGTQDAA
ncbi:TPA: hypothetical protein QHB96_003821 [Citrobacter freundii]|uniref:hypothetical protein n=1 Tax=Citrobacter sp. wls757 TaxID=2576417 RepID=UPI0010CA1B57|nr:hypothetical protein [Citrobacter sp. wls757]TKU43462.1 hypothetical protein FDW94_13775 [Citrobacter sp. wls757]HAP0441327.1 hypothetical protein [Escherichia coli]HDT5995067.1 hypothetical protein [Citrobacter freundii]HDT6034490.1 hypothetical protein [Citrobacter freundii]